MSHRRTDVVEHALEVLDRHGLADLSMRRLAADLGVQPSALYWHFANKQTLLAAVADEVLRRGERPVPDGLPDARARAYCHVLRDAMMAYRDGAELVATSLAYGLGNVDPVANLTALLGGYELADIAASTLMRYVVGHVTEEQMNLQASTAGAIDDDVLVRAETFDLGLDIVLAGVAVLSGGLTTE